jgi:hypothetical protein
MYRFYMVIPAIAIVVLNIVLPYGIAFKVVAVSGIVTLPACCWAFGRLARFRYPMPELFAIGGLLFLFDESFSIYGGNVKSTMAGEFSFSIALSLGVLGLGLLATGPRDRQVPLVGGDRARARVLVARHRADLRGARRAVAGARVGRPTAARVRHRTRAHGRCC